MFVVLIYISCIMKIEHIDNLTKGKKSWSNIWSRAVSHRLRSYERKKYEISLKNKYLQIDYKDRENLLNIWYKVCQLKWWDNLVLLRDNEIWILYKDDIIIHKSSFEDTKNYLFKLL